MKIQIPVVQESTSGTSAKGVSKATADREGREWAKKLGYKVSAPIKTDNVRFPTYYRITVDAPAFKAIRMRSSEMGGIHLTAEVGRSLVKLKGVSTMIGITSFTGFKSAIADALKWRSPTEIAALKKELMAAVRASFKEAGVKISKRPEQKGRGLRISYNSTHTVPVFPSPKYPSLVIGAEAEAVYIAANDRDAGAGKYLVALYSTADIKKLDAFMKKHIDVKGRAKFDSNNTAKEAQAKEVRAQLSNARAEVKRLEDALAKLLK